MAQSLAMVNDCDTCLTSTLSTHEVTHSNVESTRAVSLPHGMPHAAWLAVTALTCPP